MKQIIVINGSAGVGKDTFCSLAKNYAQVISISSVDEIKQVAKWIGWNGEKDDKSRKFLSDLKMLLTEYNNAPLKYIDKNIKQFQNMAAEILFIHVREPKEIDIIKKKYNAITILVNNKNVKQNRSNAADANVHHYVYDYYIDNDGTIEELKETVRKFITKLRGKSDGIN